MSKRVKNGHPHGGLTAAEQLSLLDKSPVAKNFGKGAAINGTSWASGGTFKRCYESHPALPLGDDIVVYGGSCMYPIITDADIYVGHDLSFAKSNKAYPWEEGESFLFPIQDMGVPTDQEQYVKLLDWLTVQLAAHKKVHIGCIGGHGRTGTTLAALAFLMLGEKDAISYVRKNYCEKAVESSAQIDFLHTLFGIDKVQASKGHGYQKPIASNTRQAYADRAATGFELSKGSTIFPSDNKESCVWGRNVEIVKAK